MTGKKIFVKEKVNKNFFSAIHPQIDIFGSRFAFLEKKNFLTRENFF